jgi:hypothetical protein
VTAGASRYRLRIDPWSAEYDGAAGRLEADEPAASVDTTVEHAEWRCLRPAPRAGGTPSLAFVDGVRRIDCRFVVEAGEQRCFGLFGSFAVGAARAGDRSQVVRERVGRVAATSGGFAVEPVMLRLGSLDAVYAPAPVADDDADAPLRGLQNAMRHAEAELAPELLGGADAVFVDGPLSSLATAGPLVGYVKRLLRSYLPPPQSAWLQQLAPGERTPLFLVRGAPLDRYSWYQRIGRGRAIDAGLHGVVRCECAARLGLDAARALADLAARELPRFASDAVHDARAPQNLFPIGALETHLRHRLGDAMLLRRALEAQVAASA